MCDCCEDPIQSSIGFNEHEEIAFLKGAPPPKGAPEGGIWFEDKYCGCLSWLWCCFLCESWCCGACGPYDKRFAYLDPSGKKAYKMNGDILLLPGQTKLMWQNDLLPADYKDYTPEQHNDNQILVEEVHVVINTAGLIVREGVELSSEKVGHLETGTKVTLVERSGKRVRLILPIQGWASEVSSSGHQGLQFDSREETWLVKNDIGMIVRSEVDKTSPQVESLEVGTKIRVVEKRGNRWKLDDPIAGWFSYETSSGHKTVEREAGVSLE